MYFFIWIIYWIIINSYYQTFINETKYYAAYKNIKKAANIQEQWY